MLPLPAVFSQLSHHEKMNVIRTGRARIRYHRHQRGDDRCWVDDYAVWNLIDGSPTLQTLPPFSDAMARCRDFFVHRNATAPDAAPSNAIHDILQWDADLVAMSDEELLDALTQLTAAIRKHRDISHRPRTAQDDRELYSILPEKIPADFRLPSESEFLGEEKAPHAGCPSFWRSHHHCEGKTHDFHQWGPCTPK